MHAYSFREKHGVRWFCHFGNGRNRQIGIELGWWHRFCHVGIECDDDGWNLSLAFPPLIFHLSLEGFPLWQPQRKCIATWDHSDPTREFWLVDRREFKISIHDWTIWLSPWSKWGEWAARDPWWVRGVSLNLLDLVFGRHRHVLVVEREGILVQIPMPEGIYHGTAKFERRTWKRPRWFAKTRLFTSVDVPKGGIPHAGKGENSWDCGDDGLCGWSVEGHSVECAIAHGVETVLIARRRYGMPSDEALAEASPR